MCRLAGIGAMPPAPWNGKGDRQHQGLGESGNDSPGASGGSVALPTPRLWTAGPQNWEGMHFDHLEPCGL